MTVADHIASLCERHGPQAVADAAGREVSNIYYWRRGKWAPPLAVAVRIDELLGAAPLVAAVRALREKACAKCGEMFIRPHQSRMGYCSETCQRRAWRDMRRAGRKAVIDQRVPLIAQQLKTEKRARRRLRGVIDALCAICPEGGHVCGNGECPAHIVTRMACVVTACPVRHGTKRAA